MTATDTIAAVATPPGRGGVGIVRISGPRVPEIAARMLGKPLPPRHAEYLPFLDRHGAVIDHGIALRFVAPHSFTGEDVLELQGHGGPVVMDMLLTETLALGARLARPGEFSERAFLNGKLDLAQAEAIADLIDSASQQAARSALRSLQGEFSRRVHALVDTLVELRMYVESAIDFPEEEIDFLSEGHVLERLESIESALEQVLTSAQQGQRLREGMTLVIAGQPNAGKSTLLNALTGRESAIVTDIPGTTRDVLREQILIDGLPVHVVDTAGLRESADVVEQIGIRRAWEEIARADRLLLLVDDACGVTPEDEAILARLPAPRPPLTLVRNKIDESGRAPGIEAGPWGPELRLSAREGQGIDLLRAHLKECVGYQSGGEGGFMARRRHVDALERARQHLAHGHEQLARHRAGELLAEDLRLAQEALAEITGEFTNEDLLGRIFTNFCIGK
ncbi:MAG: tRNA uridine-5-carboxymethylaminomethyl(34) synthesis GTPase MnmE [Pseudomonadota bacterium]